VILFAAQCLQIDATRETAAAYSSGERAPLLYLSSGRYEGERGGGGGGVVGGGGKRKGGGGGGEGGKGGRGS